MATPAELLHDRLRAFLLFLKPFVLSGGVDQDRLAQLRRLSDVRIRKFAIEKPQITGIDLCGLLSDPRVGRFDDVADEAGLLKKGHLSVILPTLGEDMGYLIEACLTLQVAGLAAMKEQAKAFAQQQGAVAAPAGAASGPAAKAAAAPVLPEVVKALAPLKELWSLAPSTLKAIALLGAADSPADAVCAEIERDPALAARVLKVVNASTTPKSSSIKKAVVALGYPAMRRVVMTAALAAKLAPPHAEAGFDEWGFWLRSLRTAHAAAAVSKATRLGNPEEHFSAGLLHGIGRLASAKSGVPGPAGAIGAAILERWRFPAPVVEAARHHEATADVLEELQIPREAMVVAALNCGAAGVLRVAADSLPSLLETAAKSAQAGVAELVG